MRKRVRSIHDAGDSSRTGQGANFLDGHNLPRHENHLRYVDDAGARRDALLEHAQQIRGVARRHVILQLLEHDFFATLALLPGGNHAGTPAYARLRTAASTTAYAP